jgi:adenylate cyclase
MEGAQPHDRFRIRAGLTAGVVAAALPLIGLVLLLRRQLDPHLENYRLHFVLFGLVGALAFVLGYAAGESANRRGDARVLLLSLAFMATGGFMGLHALGTPGVLFEQDHAGFKVAIPVGLLVSAGFAAASAFVDLRPGFAPLAIRHRRLLRIAILATMALWLAWTVLDLPPLSGPNSEAARGSLLTALAIVGTVVFAVGAARYWLIFRDRLTLLPLAVVGASCCSRKR